MKGVDRRRLLARAVLHVVDGHAVDVDGARQRRPESHRGQRNALATARGRFEPRSVGLVVGDDAVDEIVGAEVRDFGNRRGDVYDRVAQDYAELIVFEKSDLHAPPPPSIPRKGHAALLELPPSGADNGTILAPEEGATVAVGPAAI